MATYPSCAYNDCRGCGECMGEPPRPDIQQVENCGRNGCRGCGNCWADAYWRARDREVRR